MKKSLLLLAALCLTVACLAEDKMKLDLKITNDPRQSMFYFNGTGMASLDYDGQRLTARLDIDFEHPADGRYGSLILYDAQRRSVAQFAVTKVEMLNDATGKRITLTGFDGTRGTAEANIDFHRDRDRNYSLLIFPNEIPWFKAVNRLTFDSELRIAPREKSAGELAQEEKAQKAAEQREASKQAEIDRRNFHRNAYNAIGILVAVASIGFALWMAPRANRRRRLPHLILFTALAWFSTFPPFVLLPVLPAYFWWYYNLYNEDHGGFYLDRQFIRIALWSGGILSIVFYGLFGWIALIYAIVWGIAGYIVYLLFYFSHMEKARCPHCKYYGVHEIAKREFLDEEISKTVTRKRVYDHTEERSDRIIEWYKIKYNVRIEAHQRFRDFRRCEHCGEVFITFHYRTKTLSDRTY